LNGNGVVEIAFKYVSGRNKTMASLRTKFSVGIFVVIGFMISFISIIWLGLSHYLEQGQYFVAYFDESVQGLDKDSPVKYRGVSVGRVDSINVAPDATLIQTVLLIEHGLKPDEDLVAQLKSVGITGIMFVELDRKKEGDPDQSPRINFPSKFPIIATKPSDIRQFMTGINDILKQLKSLDLMTISGKVNATLDEITRAVAEIQMAELSASVKHSLGVWDNALTSVGSAASSLNNLSNNANRTVDSLTSLVDRNEENLSNAIAELNRSMQKAGTLFDEGTDLVKHTDAGISRVMLHLMVTLQNLDTASQNLNRTIELIADQPSQLIFGQPPPPRSVDTDN
jgi:phospholipid/cholesterol/gamma-HCH transport system substrate-binding protein